MEDGTDFYQTAFNHLRLDICCSNLIKYIEMTSACEEDLNTQLNEV